MHKVLGSEMWAHRPLTEQLLQYAARDILLIGVLYPHFIRSYWIPRIPALYEILLSQCHRYISAHVAQGKSSDTDPFRPCGIVPLDVLTEPDGPQSLCFACHRSLSRTAFETRPYTYDGQPTKQLQRSTRCRLCFALALKNDPKTVQSWLNI
jgi:exonuclease 3'-5' domain-containing protein 1